MEDILVSVICMTYNHEEYIKRTLQSLVNQKTNFKYEIIVHDDASTDNTQEIITSYQKKYPEKINAILQKENQLSQGINITYTILAPLAHGKYIAVCEGDDYWIDDSKLQKQVEYMEEHPLCTFCFTNGRIDNVQNGKHRPFIPYLKSDKKYIKEDGNYDVCEIAKLSFIPTCTFFYPKENMQKVPDYYFEKCFGGDRKISLYYTSMGYAHCINEETGCYNYGVQGSAMTKWKTKVQIAKGEYSFVKLYRNIDRFTEYKYSDEFEEYILSYLKTVYCLQGKEKILSNQDLEIVKNNLNTKIKIKKLIFDLMSEKQFNFARNIKRKYFV